MQMWTTLLTKSLGDCLAKFITVKHWNDDEEPSFYIPRGPFQQLGEAQLLEMHALRIRQQSIFIAKADGTIVSQPQVDNTRSVEGVMHSMRTLIKLKNDSITFVEEVERGVYSLQFVYTSDVDCLLDVYLNCRDESGLKDVR